MTTNASPATVVVNKPMSTAELLMTAVVNNDIDQVRTIVAAGNSVNEMAMGTYPLIRALDGGKHLIVDALLNAGADVNVISNNKQTPLLAAIGGVWRPLYVKRLIDLGADLTFKPAVTSALTADANETAANLALLKAAETQNLELATLLLDRGADVNFQKKFLKDSPLSLAVATGDEGSAAMVRLLLERGADVDIINANGWTPLMTATIKEKDEFELVLQSLLEHGADINFRYQHGNTSLINTAFMSADKGAQWLIEHGADITLKNDAGETALDVAIKRKAKAVSAMIERVMLQQAVANVKTPAVVSQVNNKRSRL